MRRLTMLTLMALVGFVATAGAQANEQAQNRDQVKAEKQVQTRVQDPGPANAGPNFVDGDADGVCDNCTGNAGQAAQGNGPGTEKGRGGFGPANGSGNDGAGPRDGSGFGAGQRGGSKSKGSRGGRR